MTFGDNAGAQIKAFGSVNTSLDQKTEEARKDATTAILAVLNVREIQNPSESIHNIANILAAGVLTTKSGESPSETSRWKQGMELLEKWRGDDPQDAKWRINIPVERFHGFVSLDEIRPHDFVS